MHGHGGRGREMSSVLSGSDKRKKPITSVDVAHRRTNRFLFFARCLAFFDLVACAIVWWAAYGFDVQRLITDSTTTRYNFTDTAVELGVLVILRSVASFAVVTCCWRGVSDNAVEERRRHKMKKADRGLAFISRSSVVQCILSLVKLVAILSANDSNHNSGLCGVPVEAAVFSFLQFRVTKSLIRALGRERRAVIRRDALLDRASLIEDGAADGDADESDDDDDKPSLTLLQLLRVLRPYFWPRATHESAFSNRLRAVMTWVFVLGSKALNVVAPLYIAKATNALEAGEINSAIINSAIYCAVLFGGKTLKEMQSVIYLKVAQAAFIELAEDTFSHLHSLSLDWHLKKKLGDVMRSTDRGISACDTLMKYLFLYLVPALAECLSVCVVFAVIYNSASMSALCFVSVVLYCYMTVKLTLWRQKFRKAVNRHDNQWHDLATDSLINFETVKYFTNEKFEVQRFSGAVQAYQKFSVSVAASLSLLNISQQVVVNATLCGCLALAAQRDNVTTGDFVATLTYVLNLFTPLNFLGSVYNAIVNAFVDLGNLSNLLAEAPDIVDAPGARQLASRDGMRVDFVDVAFHYPEQPPDHGLRGISFSVPAGTTTAVVGHTGAGKTTISRLLFRFYDPLKGSVRFDGTCLTEATQHSVRSQIGVVPQDTVLFNDTILHNISYGRLTASMEEIEAAAEAAQILSFIRDLPDGWETVVGERGLKLSGGEKQRVAIARCILKNPPLVLLDEATSALDSKTESSIQTALAHLSQNRTMLVIAHRLGTIAHADQILVLSAGVITERGTHEALLAARGEYSRMWELQSRSTAGCDGDGDDDTGEEFKG